MNWKKLWCRHHYHVIKTIKHRESTNCVEEDVIRTIEIGKCCSCGTTTEREDEYKRTRVLRPST